MPEIVGLTFKKHDMNKQPSNCIAAHNYGDDLNTSAALYHIFFTLVAIRATYFSTVSCGSYHASRPGCTARTNSGPADGPVLHSLIISQGESRIEEGTSCLVLVQLILCYAKGKVETMAPTNTLCCCLELNIPLYPTPTQADVLRLGISRAGCMTRFVCS